MHQETDRTEENVLRIVLLGKTGCGKSSVGNTILGKENFNESCGAKAETKICQREETMIDGHQIQIIDVPGNLDPDSHKKDNKFEILSCLVECAPGPHAFILVLRLGRFTKEEEKAANQLLKWFSKEALDHTVILFTHGEDLKKGKTIKDFVKEGNDALHDLVHRCGHRIHVMDNKHWNDSSSPEDRNNSFQIRKLIETIKHIKKYKGKHFSNETLEAIGNAIDIEVLNIQTEPGSSDIADIKKRARDIVSKRIPQILAKGVTTGALLGALLGVLVGIAIPFVLLTGVTYAGSKRIVQTCRKGGDQGAGNKPENVEKGKVAAITAAEVTAGAAGGVAGGLIAGLEVTEIALGAAAATGIGLGVAGGVMAVGGMVAGGVAGVKAAKKAYDAPAPAKQVAKAVAKEAGGILQDTWHMTQSLAKKQGPEYEQLNN